MKIASSLLERDFLLCFATPRRRRGGMSERSDEIPESDGLVAQRKILAQRKIPVVLHLIVVICAWKSKIATPPHVHISPNFVHLVRV